MSGSDRTGIKSFDKKDGFGKGNWGTGNDDLDGQNERLNTSFESLFLLNWVFSLFRWYVWSVLLKTVVDVSCSIAPRLL